MYAIDMLYELKYHKWLIIFKFESVVSNNILLMTLFYLMLLSISCFCVQERMQHLSLSFTTLRTFSTF
jgi:hypothetical protein